MNKRVYFMRPVGCIGPIKIGCSVEPEKRLRTIASWSPIPLELVALVAGGHAEEVAIHHRFAHLSMHGEWFAVDADLLALIDSINEGQVPDFALFAGPPNQTRRISGIKCQIARTVSNAEKRAHGFRMNIGVGRPAEVQSILDRLTGTDEGPPTAQENAVLVAYLADLQARPPVAASQRWDAWRAYRDGPNGLSAIRARAA